MSAVDGNVQRLQPLCAARLALLNLLGAASPRLPSSHLCFPRARIYYFNYFTETPPVTRYFCTLSVRIFPAPSECAQTFYLGEVWVKGRWNPWSPREA